MQVPHRKSGRYTHIKPDNHLTYAKFDELKNTLTKLKKITRPAAIVEVKRLGEMGDFSENAAYSMAKGRLRKINETVAELENQINNAIIIKTNGKQTVQLGHTVTIENEGQKKDYLILGSAETNPGAGVISHNSPLGQALLGKKIGDEIKVTIKNRTLNYKITNIK